MTKTCGLRLSLNVLRTPAWGHAGVGKSKIERCLATKKSQKWEINNSDKLSGKRGLSTAGADCNFAAPKSHEMAYAPYLPNICRPFVGLPYFRRGRSAPLLSPRYATEAPYHTDVYRCLVTFHKTQFDFKCESCHDYESGKNRVKGLGKGDEGRWSGRFAPLHWLLCHKFPRAVCLSVCLSQIVSVSARNPSCN